jgi:hypothetical protein
MGNFFGKTNPKPSSLNMLNAIAPGLPFGRWGNRPLDRIAPWKRHALAVGPRSPDGAVPADCALVPAARGRTTDTACGRTPRDAPTPGHGHT